MVVVFVLAFFALFVAIDLMQEHRRRAELIRVGEARQDAMSESEPRYVSGYCVPENFSFHRGHMWVHRVAPDQAFVGIDDFGRRLLGHVSNVSVPATGAWIEQGSSAARVHRGDRQVRLTAPISGEVVATNPRLKGNPDLVHRDSYGGGWLLRIRSPRLEEQLANLIDGSLAAKWIEDTRDRFQHRLMLASGSVIQDGGTTVDDLASVLDADEWRSLVQEFLEPAGPGR